MQREYEDLVKEHDDLFKKWQTLQESQRNRKETDPSVIAEMQLLSQQMAMLREQMEPVRPTILVSWLDVLPHLPVIDHEGNTITHATLSRAKKYNILREESILFHYERPDGTKFIRSEPNKLNVLANTWYVYLPRSEAERIGIIKYFQSGDRYRGDERPAARNSVQPIIYEK